MDKVSPLIKKLADAIEKSGCKIAFGLLQQGHIPIIKRMRKEHKTWYEIGRKIGWEPMTAKKCYEDYLKESTK